MEDIVLYSTNCPRCKVLEAKLKSKGIEYREVTDVSEMLRKGMASAPSLEVGGKLLDFGKAVQWINEVTR